MTTLFYPYTPGRPDSCTHPRRFLGDRKTVASDPTTYGSYPPQEVRPTFTSVQSQLQTLIPDYQYSLVTERTRQRKRADHQSTHGTA